MLDSGGPNPGGLVLIPEDVLVRRGKLGQRNGPLGEAAEISRSC